jgi:glycyl-tRNA synthetase
MYFDQERNERYFPTVVETSCGLDRICLALLCNGYAEDTAETKKEGLAEDVRVVLRLAPAIAPVQVAVLPLSKKLEEKAEPVFKDLKRRFRADYDVTGSIGKRYRRQDEIGTPYCVTIDFDTLNDQAATVRDRDAMTQERVGLGQLKDYLADRVLPA